MCHAERPQVRATTFIWIAEVLAASYLDDEVTGVVLLPAGVPAFCFALGRSRFLIQRTGLKK